MKIIQKIIDDYFSNDYQNNNKYIKNNLFIIEDLI